MPEIGAGGGIPELHHTTHENAGTDEIDVTGLSGLPEIVDTPADAETTKGISSNWAYDHAANKDAHHAVFVDRGDPTELDFTEDQLTADNAWHDLNLASIVPAGAIAVLLRFDSSDIGVGSSFMLRKNGNSNAINTSIVRAQVALNRIGADLVCALDSNRVIEYNFSTTTWNYKSLHVRGWWI